MELATAKPHGPATRQEQSLVGKQDCDLVRVLVGEAEVTGLVEVQIADYRTRASNFG
jgi:hypothetical protein